MQFGISARDATRAAVAPGFPHGRGHARLRVQEIHGSLRPKKFLRQAS